MKKEARILGISDSNKYHKSSKIVNIIGVVFRGALWLEGIMSTKIERNGSDATLKLTRMIESSPYYKQIRLIMLDGLVFAGLNMVDIKILHKKIKIPIIVILRSKNQLELLVKQKGARKDNFRRNILKILDKKVPAIISLLSRPVYFYFLGISFDEARNAIKWTCVERVPEPIRVARIVSSVTNQIN